MVDGYDVWGEKMRIALMPHSYLPNVGGVEMVTRYLARALQERGHQVAIIAGRGHYFQRSTAFPLCEVIDGIRVYRCDFAYPYLREGIRPVVHFALSFPITVIRFFLILLRFRPDVVNVHMIWKQSFYAWLMQPLFGFAMVLSAHGPTDVVNVPAHPKPLLWRYLRYRVMQRARIITADSRYLLGHAFRLSPGNPRRYCYIPNGICLPAIAGGRQQAVRRPYVFSIGRFHWEKGFDVLIRAFARLAARYPAIDLVIAGDGPEKDNLETLAGALGIARRVVLAGTVFGKEKSGYFSNCMFFVLPSRRESFGITVIEAMASKKAVVATDVGGVAEYFRDGVNGYLVPPEDPQRLAAAMERLLREPRQRARYGGINRVAVETAYTWQRVAAAYESVYRGRAVDGPEVAAAVFPEQYSHYAATV